MVISLLIDSADSITKDKNLSPADRVKFYSIKLEYLALLRDATEASITSPDLRSVLKKIVEHRCSREPLTCH